MLIAPWLVNWFHLVPSSSPAAFQDLAFERRETIRLTHQLHSCCPPTAHLQLVCTPSRPMITFPYPLTHQIQSSLRQSPSVLRQSPSVSVSLHQFPSVSISLRQSPSVSVSFRQFPSVSVSFRQSPSVSVSFRQFPSVSISLRQTTHLFPSVSVSLRQFPSVSASFRQFSVSLHHTHLFPSVSASVRQFPSVSINLNKHVCFMRVLGPWIVSVLSHHLLDCFSFEPSLAGLFQSRFRQFPSVSVSFRQSPSVSVSFRRFPSV